MTQALPPSVVASLLGGAAISTMPLDLAKAPIFSLLDEDCRRTKWARPKAAAEALREPLPSKLCLVLRRKER